MAGGGPAWLQGVGWGTEALTSLAVLRPRCDGHQLSLEGEVRQVWP